MPAQQPPFEIRSRPAPVIGARLATRTRRFERFRPRKPSKGPLLGSSTVAKRAQKVLIPARAWVSHHIAVSSVSRSSFMLVSAIRVGQGAGKGHAEFRPFSCAAASRCGVGGIGEQDRALDLHIGRLVQILQRRRGAWVRISLGQAPNPRPQGRHPRASNASREVLHPARALARTEDRRPWMDPSMPRVKVCAVRDGHTGIV
ncbi:hypothetical protein ANO11243_055930 [Dothideomycetidae sp. 11243]|nr:hypothetical protein ANO11243_055930 [fungal sp. No.11243]